MDESDWDALVRLLVGLGLMVVSIDRATGRVVVQVRL